MRSVIYRYNEDTSEYEEDGRFLPAKAEEWDRDEDTVSQPHQWTRLLRTAKGRWLAGHMSRERGVPTWYEAISADTAEQLIQSRAGRADIDRHFGGPGRPSEGTRVDVR